MKFDPLSNSPLMQIINTVRGGGDPSPIVRQVISNHPYRQQVEQIISGKNPHQIMQTAENMCRERGMNLDDVLRRMGFTR